VWSYEGFDVHPVKFRVQLKWHTILWKRRWTWPLYASWGLQNNWRTMNSSRKTLYSWGITCWKRNDKHVSEYSVIRNELHAYSSDCFHSAIKSPDTSHIHIRYTSVYHTSTLCLILVPREVTRLKSIFSKFPLSNRHEEARSVMWKKRLGEAKEVTHVRCYQEIRAGRKIDLIYHVTFKISPLPNPRVYRERSNSSCSKSSCRVKSIYSIFRFKFSRESRMEELRR
jgi:hypothetical protein